MELPKKVFSGSDLDTSIYILNKTASSDETVTHILSVRDCCLTESAEWKRNADVTKREWIEAGSKFSFDFDAAEARILSKIRQCSEPLQNSFDYSQGLVPYAREEFYRTMSKEQADRIVDERVWHSDSQRTPEFKRELRGDDVDRYSVTWNGKQWIRYGPWLARPREARFFRVARVLIQEITRGKTLRAGYTEEEYYNNPGIIIVTSKPGHTKNEQPSLSFLTALCNSSLFFFWHILNSPKAKLVTSIPKILVEDVAGLPIRRIGFTASRKDRDSLLAKSKQLCQHGVANKNPAGVLAFVTEQLAAKLTDIVHDLLAFLAEQMAALNREQRAAAKQFLTDLKDFHGVDVHALNPKTKLEKFWELETADVFAHFRTNKLRLKESDEETIRTRFQSARDKVVPLNASLTFTDDLIDEIVFRLYGLTPDEIRIVKEASK